ncbi:MAG: DNA replication protein, partial [bacterium]|nr:DNA replication protein [bacterium]
KMPELGFLWQRQSFLKDIEDYAKYIFNKETDSFYIPTRIFRKLFLKGKEKLEENKLNEKREEFIKYTITNNIDNFQYVCFIFSAANSMREKFKIELLDIFLKKNNNFEDFKTLECGYGLWVRGWEGSKVPILEREKNYIEKIIPLLSTVELLEHKAYIEKQIEFKINEIEIEKKRDFLGN